MMVQNRQCFITVLPTAAPLLIKALKEGPRDRKKVKNVKHNGNLKMDDIIDIAKKLRPKSMAIEFAGTVKEVLGTAVSLGCTIDGKSPKEYTQLIDSGEYEVHEWVVVISLKISKYLRYKLLFYLLIELGLLN